MYMNSNDTWRNRLYVIIFQTDTVAGRRFDSSLLLIILASLVVVSWTASMTSTRTTPACWRTSSGASR